MRFTLIDQIIELEPGVKITAVKNVSLAEEYLQDHFPKFPVLPGVLMLEAMVQSCAWLLRVSEDFAHSMVLLKEARNIKFADFVAPGHSLSVAAQLMRQDERLAQFKVQGTVDGLKVVSGRLVLERYNLADTNPDEAAIDMHVKHDQRKLLSLLYPGNVSHQAAVPVNDLSTAGKP